MSFKIRRSSEHTGRLGPLCAIFDEFQMKMSRNVIVNTVKEAMEILENSWRSWGQSQVAHQGGS